MARQSIVDIAKRLQKNTRELQILADRRRNGNKQTLSDFVKKYKRTGRLSKDDQQQADNLENIAEQRYRRTRGTGVNLDRLLASIDRIRRANALRDKVTVTDIRRAARGNALLSKSLTYDRSGIKVRIRPHKHVVKHLPSSGEAPNTPLSQCKRISFWCDCQDYMYRFEYSNATRWGCSEIRNEGADLFPVQTNPGLRLGACKHAYVLLRYIKQRGL